MKNSKRLNDPKLHAINSHNGKFDIKLPSVSIDSCGLHKVLEEEHKISRPYGRKNYQIIYIKSGKAHFFVDGREIIAKEGNFILYHPMQPQEYIYYRDEGCEVYWIHFNGDNIDTLLKECGFSKGFMFYVGLNRQYLNLLENIIFEISGKQNFFEHFASVYFLLLIFAFARGHNKSGESVKDGGVWPAVLALQQEYMYNIRIEKYAEICHLSYSRFTHLFTESVGCSPLAYRQNLRIEHAKESLRASLSSIQHISDSLGFTDQKYFSVFFKKATGYSPSQYRKKHRQQ